ncbi:Metal transporter Nramp6 [Forsythia ovata]|uniref:Metal transporter Nramp6 n=1 Tax=Forsythia ovata TaxID=205694 RepID=A0ABD1WZ39_9LAMI
MALVQIQETPHWKKVLNYIGPGFLVSVAYLDPGNFTMDCARWPQFRSHDSISFCKSWGGYRTEYHIPINYCLWILAEIAVIAADIPEVLGTAFALNILFNVPMWSGVLLAGLNTLLLLGLQRYGMRKLEIAIGALVLVVGGCFCSVMVHANPNVKEIAMRLFIPKLRSSSATRDAIALLGALVMPHNLFLHSALVTSRKIPRSVESIRSASRYFLMESGLALFIAFLINVAVISVSGTVCSNPNISSQNKHHCTNITLNSASFLLKNALGKWSSKLYAISLLASGQSSTVTGTYAGQYIMQMILSFELPFALVPLLKFTSSEAKMGVQKNSIMVSLVLWFLGACSIGINLYFLGSTFLGWITRDHMSKAAAIITCIVISPFIILYILILLYLIFKPEIPNTDSPDEFHESEFEREMEDI